jgi:hypothetical protein
MHSFKLLKSTIFRKTAAALVAMGGAVDRSLAPIGTVRRRLAEDAARKALKAYARHGENSYQYQRAIRSRWLVVSPSTFATRAAGNAERRRAAA